LSCDEIGRNEKNGDSNCSNQGDGSFKGLFKSQNGEHFDKS